MAMGTEHPGGCPPGEHPPLIEYDINNSSFENQMRQINANLAPTAALIKVVTKAFAMTKLNAHREPYIPFAYFQLMILPLWTAD